MYWTFEVPNELAKNKFLLEHPTALVQPSEKYRIHTVDTRHELQNRQSAATNNTHHRGI